MADMSSREEVLRIMMLGKTGAGKSATGNTILGYEAFESKFAAESLTQKCQKAVGHDRKVSVVDTPGLFCTRFSQDKNIREIKRSMCFAAPGPHVFLLVIKLGAFTIEEQECVKMIQDTFGEESNKYTMILFTRGDVLDGPVEDFLNGSPRLQELISKCGGGYHVFNNKSRDPSQVTELLAKIEAMVEKNGGSHSSHYTTEMFRRAERAIEEETTRILTYIEAQRRASMAQVDAADMPRLITAFEESARNQAVNENAFLSNTIGPIMEVAKQVLQSIVITMAVQVLEKYLRISEIGQ